MLGTRMHPCQKPPEGDIGQKLQLIIWAVSLQTACHMTNMSVGIHRRSHLDALRPDTSEVPHLLIRCTNWSLQQAWSGGIDYQQRLCPMEEAIF